MATNQTENFGLNQWELSDEVRVEDFNADNRKTDETLHSLQTQITDLSTIAVGTYTGDGATKQTISLPFTPRLLYVSTDAGKEYNYSDPYHYIYGGLVAPGVCFSGLSIVTNGFTVMRKTIDDKAYYTNRENQVFRYIAFK